MQLTILQESERKNTNVCIGFKGGYVKNSEAAVLFPILEDDVNSNCFLKKKRLEREKREEDVFVGNAE